MLWVRRPPMEVGIMRIYGRTSVWCSFRPPGSRTGNRKSRLPVGNLGRSSLPGCGMWPWIPKNTCCFSATCPCMTAIPGTWKVCLTFGPDPVQLRLTSAPFAAGSTMHPKRWRSWKTLPKPIPASWWENFRDIPMPIPCGLRERQKGRYRTPCPVISR